MNLLEIEKLLDKYFEGETTLSEEEMLRKYFASGEVPEKWRELKGFFLFLEKEAELKISDPGFDEKVMGRIKEGRLATITDVHRPWIYWIAGVAASILILVAVFVKFDPFTGRIEDTYKDPQTAYLEARKILLYVSAKFNQGTSSLEPVNALQTGLNEMKPVASYNNALNNVNRLNEVEKVQNLIQRN